MCASLWATVRPVRPSFHLPQGDAQQVFVAQHVEHSAAFIDKLRGQFGSRHGVDQLGQHFVIGVAGPVGRKPQRDTTALWQR